MTREFPLNCNVLSVKEANLNWVFSVDSKQDTSSIHSLKRLFVEEGPCTAAVLHTHIMYIPLMHPRMKQIDRHFSTLTVKHGVLGASRSHCVSLGVSRFHSSIIIVATCIHFFCSAVSRRRPTRTPYRFCRPSVSTSASQGGC